MSRKEKNNVDYFPHPCLNGKKMNYLENKYGNDGYAAWYKILERLGDAQFHYLDINDELTIMDLASYCRVEENILRSILGDLLRMGEFDKKLFEEGILFNEKFNFNVADAYSRRSNKIITRDQLVAKLYSLNRIIDVSSVQLVRQLPEKVDQNTQSKVKYSKVKQSKENIESFFFKINGKIFTDKVSDHVKKEFQIQLQTWEMQHQKNYSAIFPKLCEQIDIEYNGYEFNNSNHIWNTFKTIWKQLTDGKYKKTASEPSGRGYSQSL